MASNLKPLELLQQLPIEDRAKLGRPLVSCYAGDTCKDALEKMRTTNLSCLPVFGSASEADNLVGLIDLSDIVNLVAKMHWNKLRNSTEHKKFSADWTQWGQYTVAQALTDRKRSPTTVADSATLADVAKVLVTTRVPRVLVRSGSGSIVGVITQTDVVNALHSNMAKLSADVANRQLSQFKHIQDKATRAVIAVDRDHLAIDAFRLMADEQISALPVIDFDGNRTPEGTLTHRDVRGVLDDADFPLGLYNQSALAFSLKMHGGHEAKLKPLSIALQLTSTLKDAVDTMHQYHIHQVWVMNEKNQVAHVVSLTDLLAEALNN